MLYRALLTLILAAICAGHLCVRCWENEAERIKWMRGCKGMEQRSATWDNKRWCLRCWLCKSPCLQQKPYANERQRVYRLNVTKNLHSQHSSPDLLFISGAFWNAFHSLTGVWALISIPPLFLFHWSHLFYSKQLWSSKVPVFLFQTLPVNEQSLTLWELLAACCSSLLPLPL